MNEMLTVIFAGGKGTRMGGGVPKPLVKLDKRPLVEHVVSIYRSQDYSKFMLLGGYMAASLSEWAGTMMAFDTMPLLNVWVADTGVETQTGGRLARVGDTLHQHGRFFLTYADGLADINLAALLDHHRRMREASGAMVTLTAVNPTNRFGKVNIENGVVTGFSEKLADACGWVNGGFYVVESEVLTLMPQRADACVFERDILPVLAVQGRLAAYQHPGDFLCVDTPRDLAYARDLCKSKQWFWLRWEKQT